MLLLMALACKGGEVDSAEALTPLTADDCRQLYTIDNGYGYDDDPMWQWTAKSPAMIVEYYCEYDERACSEEDILTREAAKCIAEVEGITDPEPDMELHFRGPEDTLWWVVEGLTYGERGGVAYGGDSVEIDAWGVEPIEHGDWDQSDCQSGFG